MENITVNLISNNKNNLQNFLQKYFEKSEYELEEKTFRWSCIFSSALKSLDLIIVAAESKEEYNMDVFVNLPEFDAIINENNLDSFIRYIYYRESCN